MISFLAVCVLATPPGGANFAVTALPDGGVVSGGYVMTAERGSDCRVHRRPGLAGPGWTLDDGEAGSDACLAVAAWGEDRVVAAGVTYRDGAGGQAYIIGIDEKGRRAFRIAHGTAAHEELRGLAMTDLGIVGVGLKREPNATAKGYLVIADPEKGILGQEALGGAGEHRFEAVTSTADGEIVAVGSSAVPDGLPAAWIVRIKRNGDTFWEHRIGGAVWHEARDVVVLEDGRIVVVGMAYPGAFLALLAANGTELNVVRRPLLAPFASAVRVDDCIAAAGGSAIQFLAPDLSQRSSLASDGWLRSVSADATTLHAVGWLNGGRTTPLYKAWPRRVSWCTKGP